MSSLTNATLPFFSEEKQLESPNIMLSSTGDLPDIRTFNEADPFWRNNATLGNFEERASFQTLTVRLHSILN